MSLALRPRFSVVIANFDYAAYICEAVRSALDQQGMAEQLEVIVVDDGSTDTSLEALATLAHEPRLRVLTQENRGQTAAFEVGVAAARGDYICFLDSDDLFLPDKLARVSQHIDSLGIAADELLLCHDLHIVDTQQARTLEQGWFRLMGIDRLGDSLDPARVDLPFPFSIPCGLVMGRGLALSCLQAMPSWDFRRGADGPLCMSAMLKVWRVYYLHEALSLYRVHGANEAARIVDGQYSVGIRLNERIPRLLSFLERWVDALDLPHDERQLRLSCLRWLEHLNRMPSPARRLLQPAVDVAVLDDADGAAAQSVRAQSHAGTSLWLAPAEGRAEDDLTRLAHAYRATRGDYLLFMADGDRLDRECVERHLFWRQHGALVGLSCSDVRLCARDGSLVHADAFANSGAWKQHLQQVPPLATRLQDWVAPPLAACMFRRNALLDALFDQVASLPPVLRRSGAWLPIQLQHHSAGLLRMRESLVSIRLPDGAAASYGFLSTPATLGQALFTPAVGETSLWLADFYRREQALFRRYLPPVWHERFARWLEAATAAPAV